MNTRLRTAMMMPVRRAMLLAAHLLLALAMLLPTDARAQCTNCTVSTVGTETLLRFVGAGTFTPPAGVTTVRYVLVGGGGGGGGVLTTTNIGGAGGGGAGGYLTGTTTVTPSGLYTIVVGAGGAGGLGGVTMGGNGGNSSFASLTALGGGGGATRGVSDNGANGGSGGGGRILGSGGNGTTGQGRDGGDGGGNGASSSGGGGGGAGGAGANGSGSNFNTFLSGGAGGAGITDTFAGTSNTWAAGGTGGVYGASVNGVAATFYGNGGSGAGGTNGGATRNGGAGFQGIVLIRYAAPTRLSITTQPASSAQNGVAFSQQPVIQLRDAAGNAVSQPNVSITVSIASGGGTLGGTTTVLTDSSGRASFTDLMITGTVGTRTLAFNSTGLTGVTSGTITLTAGPAAQLAIVTQPVGGVSGSLLTTQPVVEIRDTGGNRVSASNNVTVSIVSGSGGTLGGSLTVSGILGTVSFTNLALTGNVLTNYVLRFSATGLIAVDSNAVTVTSALPLRLNVFDTTTPIGALTGVLTTRVAGSSFPVSVIAIATGGLTLSTSYGGTVQIDWMYAADNSGTDPGTGCRSSWVYRGPAGTATLVSGGTGRVNTNLTPVAVGREWRLRLSTTLGGTTLTSCSSDALAVIPAAFSIGQVGDADAGSAGTTRSLTNTSATGGVVHKAGQPFSLRASALDSAGGLATGYDGAPRPQLGACVLPASGCTPGTLSYTSVSAASGAISSDTLSYSQVGAIGLSLIDDTFAAIDAADTALPARTIVSSVVNVGRFVPDHYRLSVATAGLLAAAQNACAAAARGFTFVGQPFAWASLPRITVTAENAANATTTNWTGTLQRLSAASDITRTLAVTNAGGLTLTPTWAAMTLTDTGAGTASVAFSAADRFAFARAAATPVASFQPSIDVAIAVADASEAATSGNPTVASLASVNASGASALGFDNGGYFHYGRLRLQNAFGDARRSVSALIELQAYTANGWLRLDDDRGCISLPVNAFGFGGGTGFLASSACAAPVSAAVTTQRGRALVALGKSPGNAAGATSLYINTLGTTEGASCIGSPAAAGTPVSTALTYLATVRAGGSGGQDSNPLARIVWGRIGREWIAQRELY